MNNQALNNQIQEIDSTLNSTDIAINKESVKTNITNLLTKKECLELITINVWITNKDEILEFENILKYAKTDNLYFFINECKITDKDTLLKIESLLRYQNINVIKDNLEVFEIHWLNNKNDIVDFKDVLVLRESGSLNNLLEVLHSYWIGWRKDLLDFINILMHWKSRIIDYNLSVLESHWITDKNDLLEFQDILIHANFKTLDENLTILKNHWITNKNDFIRLQDVLIYTLPYNLNMILDNNKESDKDSIIDYILKNAYICDKEKLNFKHFKYTKLDNKDLEELTKYRNPINSDTFIDNLESSSQAFSILDIETSKKISWKQKKGKEITIWDMNFFHINNDKWITTEEQLLVNRIFAPYFPMTRLLKLKNWKVDYVSINIEDKIKEWKDLSGKEVCWFKDSVPKEIKSLFRLLYQFLTWDFDRCSWQNLSRDWIVFDFDYIFNRKRNNIYHFKYIFEKHELHDEITKLLFIIKNYIHNYCIEELKRYNNRLSSALDKNKQKDTKLKIKLLENILNKEKQLSMTNLVSFLLIEDKKTLDYATASDNENFT